MHEVPLRVPDREHRTGSCPDDLFRHAAHQQVRQATSPMGADHHQIDALGFGIVDNCVRGRVETDEDSSGLKGQPIVVGHELLQLLIGLFLQSRLDLWSGHGVPTDPDVASGDRFDHVHDVKPRPELMGERPGVVEGHP